MDINEEIRFRVVDEVFTDLSPAGPEMSGEKKSTDDTENKRSPYSITVSHFAILKGKEVSIVNKSPNESQTVFHVPWGRGTPYMIYIPGIYMAPKSGVFWHLGLKQGIGFNLL